MKNKLIRLYNDLLEEYKLENSAQGTLSYQ